MPQSDKEFLIRVRADIEKAVADMRKLSGEIGKTGRESKSAAAGTKSMGLSLKGLATAASAYLSVATAIKALRMADEWNTLQQRIRTATKETGDYNAVSEQLYAIAQRNGTAMEGVVSTFQRMSLARDALGATNDEILKVTASVQGLARLSGTSASAMSAGMLQFAQAMSAGTVRAEELNSIIENMPAVANRIAKGMGLTTAELRQAVLDGKVLSREVFDALLRQSEQIADETAEVPLSMQQSWQVATTSLTNFLSRLDDLTGVTDFISKALQDWASILDSMAQPEYELAELQARRLELLQQIAQQEAYIASFRGPEFARQDLLDALDKERAKLKQIEEQLVANNQAALEYQQTSGTSETGEGDKPTPTKPTRAGRVKADPNEATVKALELEAATYGMTAEQIALYRLQVEGASQAQLERARSALDSIAADEQFEAAVRASEEAVKAENAALYEAREAQRTYLDAVIASVDPTYALVQELERLEQLMATFPEHAEIIQEAMLNVHEEMDGLGDKTEETEDEMSQFAIQAARNIQSSFADFLFDPFDKGLDGMLRGFVDTLRRMAAEMLAQAALKSFFTAMADGSTTGIWAQLAAGIQHTGGIAGSGPTRRVSPLLFANAPRYHDGGIAGLAPTEVPAILQRGEEVLPRNDPRHAANGGGQMGLNLVLVDDRGNIGDYMSSSEGNQVQMEFVKRNAGAIRRVLSI